MFEESVSEIPSSIWASMISWFTPTVLFVLLNLMIGTIAFTSKLTTQKHHHDQHQNEPHHHHDETKIARSTSVLQRLKSINFYAHYRSHQEPQNLSVHHKPSPDSATLFNLEHTGQNLEPQSHYFFQAAHQENLHHTPHQSEDPYVYEGTHEERSQETQTQFVFEQKDSHLDDFQQAHEEKVEEEDDELQSMDEIYSQLKGGHFSRTKSDTEPASGEIPTRLPARMRKSASLKSAFGHFEEENIVEARRPATVRERSNAKVTEGDEEVDARADDFINKFKQQLKLQRLDSILRYKDMIGRGIGGR
ncbi:UNVERIFIED_CONTAM: Pathogen-associated molecular patterns-induced protein A70 [Sesamum angustifolium]|uniref:Pathogen-associated molecular patterns-induced protein A70 n=1 Tax=Sesamum angustifolium TaxID=2727405 RepID=A0AAW2M8U4_9LAMI